MKICIDAGHNNSNFDTGAQGNGLREQDITFEIARLTGGILNQSGVSVKLTRNNITDNLGTNLSTSLSTRAKIANDFGADLFISVHCNAHNDTSANGTECYVYALNSAVYPLAVKINSHIVNRLGTTNRGVKPRPDLAVLRQTNMQAILVETAFISNPSDAEKLRTRQADFARAIADAILEHHGLSKRYSYDNTVNNMILDGITTPENMQYWEKALDGREPLNKEYVRAVLDRYHAKLNAK